jgi:hypothetical protein
MKEAPNSRCPRCGRRLPGGGRVLAPVVAGFFWIATNKPSRPELVGQCLVDGRSRHRARDVDLAELFDSGRLVADALRSKGWTKWAKTFDWALARPDIETRAEALGEALRLFDLYGPGESDGDAETLFASLGRHWPPSTADGAARR